jgi:Tfp pilus assembly protein PilF
MARTLSIALVSAFLLALLAANGPAKNPQEAARLNTIGVAYMNQQLFEKALKSFEQAAANDPELEVTTVNRGIALLHLQRLEEAKALLEKAVKKNPKDAHAWYNLGLYYKNSGDASAAVDAFRRVTEIDANDADTWYFLGSTYAQLKQFPEAISAFEQALKLDPHHASAQFGLARAYQQSGQADPAHEAMKKFQYITQNKLGSPISLAYGEQGKYSRAEDSPLAVEKVAAAIPVKFVDVTAEAGIVGRAGKASTRNEGRLLNNEMASFVGPGACFLDYDADGRTDIFVADNGPEGGLGLYHNLGDGRFQDVTKKAGLDSSLHGIGCTAGDYDNDGATDLAVSFEGRPVVLLHNERNGTFKDVTQTAGLDSGKLFNMGLTFVDFDHDGDLDLYITRFVPPLMEVAPGAPPEPWFSGNGTYRNNGNGTFTDVTASVGLGSRYPSASTGAIGTDYNNDRAVDIVVTGRPPIVFENPREGKFPERKPWSGDVPELALGVTALDFNHDGWMDLAFTHWVQQSSGKPALTLWRNKEGKSFEPVELPKTDWARAYGVAAIDYDNDGWVDLVAVGETKDGKGEVRLFRNLGPDGWKDVTADVGLDKIQLKEPRAIIAGDYDNDGAVDLLITQNHGPAVLLRNEGRNKNNSLRLTLKGLNDNKSAIGTKVEVFSEGIRQKFEVYGSSGYLGQNSPYLTIGLGQSKVADVVRLLWPTGVLQDEIEVAANKLQNIQEIDRRGSSCPTLFAWNGHEYELVGDMLGAGVVGHWIAAGDGKVERNIVRNIARPTEAIKLNRASLQEKDDSHPSQNQGRMGHPMLSFRFMEPLEESVYLDQVKLLSVDHPADVDAYPNEYFASNPPYPPFNVVFSNKNDARPPAGAWDEHGHNVLPDLLAHHYFGDFKVLPFLGFTEPHSLELDLGEPYRGGPLWLLLHGEIEYFSATSMYAADQAHLRPVAPYVEALVEPSKSPADSAKGSFERAGLPCRIGCSLTAALAADGKSVNGKWLRIVDDLGFPAGGARTMTADLTGKLPLGTRRIRITTNLQIYWDNILISRTGQKQALRLTPVPLARADLSFHGFPLKIEGQPPGNVKYIYEQTSATGPYTRPGGAYTRYGDVRPLLDSVDDKFVVFGSGDEVALDFDPAKLPALPRGWVRDYFFIANGYEKDMDFYAYRGDTVEPLPFQNMRGYPYPGQSFPADAEHLNYLLEYNTRFMSGNEAGGYSFQYPK